MSITSINNEKLKNVEFIKAIGNIRVSKECEKENVKTNNFYKLEVSPEKLENIKNNIDKEIKEIYEAYNENNTL